MPGALWDVNRKKRLAFRGATQLPSTALPNCAELYRHAVNGLLQFIPESELPMPPGQFVRVLHALTDGLLFLTPELITDEVIIAAFEALA